MTAFTGFLDYIAEGSKHYKLSLEKFVGRNFFNIFEYFSLANLPLIFKLKALAKHYANTSRFFRDERLKAAFTFQNMYLGLSPYDAPATFSLLQYTEMAGGVWYPMGGLYRVIESLTSLAEAQGVRFLYDTPVQQIEVEGKRATGVTLKDGSRMTADVIIANADLPYVYQHPLPQDGLAKALARKRFSCSVISFFWGVDKTYEALGPHTLFLADDYRENFESIIRDLSLPANPSLYIHAPARLDPSMAPRGQDTLTAIVPVGHMSEKGGQNWGEIRDEARQHVFRRLRTLGITDIESHIKFEEAYTPVSWAQRYNLAKGSTHGLSHTVTQMAYLRPSNRHPRYENLYFAGASTHPGTGMPTAMVSGRLVSERIMDELGA